ncbi:hypothetical protein RYH80_02450 [Halobaculum sp. MBLA0147]|uniref:hypothetical protein n=1 Tax=Halobaculum sp. MBLA0147 TaxID=3079934 RepID=UPI003523378D
MLAYDAVADFPFSVEAVALERRARDTSSGFERVTTTIHLHGESDRGRGEDVTYTAADHDALYADPEAATPAGPGVETAAGVDFGSALTGEWTVAEFAARLDELDLFPVGEPEMAASHHYRRWGFESAALDLALRANDRDFATALGTTADPVRFAASTRLGEPPTTDRVDTISDRVPGIEFKLDPTSEWTDAVIEGSPADRVRVVDFKGHYEGTDVDQEPDPDLYERVIEAFPEAVIEDPALTEATVPVLADHHERIAWDAPITGVESVEALPFEPSWLNVKPSRFGSVESLFETLQYAAERGMSLYGGGQFELGVGRTHVQTLAAVAYPDAPNDVAPGAFNDPTVPDRLPASPLAPRSGALGFEF